MYHSTHAPMGQALPTVLTPQQAEQQIAQEIDNKYIENTTGCPPGQQRIPPDPRFDRGTWWRCVPACAWEYLDSYGSCRSPAIQLPPPGAALDLQYKRSIAAALDSAMGPPKSYGETMRRRDQIECAPQGMRLMNERCATYEQLRAAGAAPEVLADAKKRRDCANDPSRIYDARTQSCRTLTSREQRIVQDAAASQPSQKSNTSLYVALGVSAAALVGVGIYLARR